MSSPESGVLWLGGEAALRAKTEALAKQVLANDPSIELVQTKVERRRILKGALASGEICLIKHYLRPRKRGPRERARSALGLSTARREFANLRRLAGRGVAVPDPLALLAAANGDTLLVLRFLEGAPLPDALERSPDRRSLLWAVGRLVAQMHESGTAHRDLHANNLWATPEGPVLLDLQEALPVRAKHLRWRDRGELDASLAPRLSLPEQLVLRMALLGIERPLDAHSKAALRRLARAGAQRRRAHVVSRTVRSLRPGRLYAALRTEAGTGMRWRESDEAQILRALADPTSEPGLVVRRYDPSSRFESIRWRLRGSPARRAWIASHGLRSRGIPAPAAIAFVEAKHGPAQLVLADELEATGEGLDGIIALALRAQRDGVLHASLPQEPLGSSDGVRGFTRLEDIRFAPRRGTRADPTLDAFVEARIRRSTALSQAQQEDALATYRAKRSFQVFP